MPSDRTIRVRFLADVAGLRAAMQRAGSDMQGFGRKMEMAGRGLTMGLTLPLAAAGVASVKFANDFEAVFSRMVGLAGVPAAEVDKLRESVLELAGDTAVAPQELAEALYEAASAGLTAEQAMAAVAVAAEGAAAGMGTTGDIVGLTASAIASYGAANMTAAEATDVLTATIRAGRADPSELASTLGRVLPIASQLGVSFDQVGGTVAYLSNVFGDTNRTVTATQGLLVKLLSPSQQGRDALQEMGTSVEELHAAISEDGLLGALDLLRERGFADNQEALAKLFDDIEGRQGAMALLADESGQLAGTLGEVEDSSGSLAEAFGERLETDAHQAQQAITDVKVSLIEVGTVLAPLAADVAGFVSSAVDLFNDLPDPVQTAVVAFGGLLAATGPLMTVGGKLVANWKAISGVLNRAALSAVNTRAAVESINVASTASAAGASRMGLALKGVGFVGAAVGAGVLAGALTDSNINVDRLAGSLRDLDDAQSDQAQGLVLGLESMGKLDGTIEDLADTNVLAAEKMLEVAEAAGIQEDRLAELRTIVEDKRESDAQGAADQRVYADQTQAAADAIVNQSGAMDAAATSADKLEEAMTDLAEAVFASFDSDVAYRRALNSTEDAMADLAEVSADSKSTQEDVERATLDVEDALLNQASAAVRAAEDQAALNGETLTAQEKADIYKRELFKLGATLQPGSALHTAILGHITAIDAIPESANTVVNVDSDQAEAALRRVMTAIASVSTSVGVSINPFFGGAVHEADGGLIAQAEAAGRMPLYRAAGGVLFEPRGTDTVPAMLTPGEFVMRKQAVDRIGLPMLRMLNAGSYAKGDLVSAERFALAAGFDPEQPGIVVANDEPLLDLPALTA